MNIKELHDKYLSKELTVEKYIGDIFLKIKEDSYNSFITLNEEVAMEKARELDKKILAGERISGLFGVPVSVKDNVLTEGLRTTAASDILEHFVPVYNATIVDKLNESNAIIIGKTNMDELAMGASSETSHFGAVVNPFDKNLVPGGSSSGSAVSVAADESIVSIGTDTGGSCRNPGNYCNVVGFAPSYGAISRFGVISMANSFDRVGILSKNVSDIKAAFDVIRGIDKNDFTSIDLEEPKENIQLEGLKVAAIRLKKEYNTEPQVEENYNKVLKFFEDNKSIIEFVDLDLLDYVNQVYTVIMSVEVSSNIAKLDGIRYGESIENYTSTEDLFRKNRTYFLGEEVKRRIALGDYFSSKESNQKYYVQAMKIRNMLKKEMDNLLEKVDVFISPTNTDLPHTVGSKLDDANSSFNSGTFNVITNISNLPSISIPVSKDKLGSIQIIGSRNEDYKLLKIAELIEGGIA